MKNTIYKIAICTVILISSCTTGKDLYEDPNLPSTVSPALALTSVEVNTFLNTEGDMARLSSVFSQQLAGAADYAGVQNYLLAAGDYNNQWGSLYSNAMYNAKLMIDKYSTANPYYAGMAKVLMVINLAIVTDFWGDVPYSEAFKGSQGFFTAPYDKQQQVYTAMQSLLDAAIIDFGKPATANTVIPATDDIIHNGDVQKWTRAAWTLKARYANRLSLKDPQGSATQVLTYLSKGIASAEDNMENIHNSTSQNLWGAYQNDRAGSLFANKRFIDALVANNDPRLPFYFTPSGGTAYIGADITQEQIGGNTIAVIGPYFAVGKNYGLVTFHEAKFLEAEAKQRLGTDASSSLNDAIKASVSYVTAGANNGSSIAIYTAATTNLTSVMTEKWKAMFGHMEAYHDFRRTGLPALTPRPQSAGAALSSIPKRLPTPTNESDSNPNALFIPLDQPVWWAGGE